MYSLNLLHRHGPQHTTANAKKASDSAKGIEKIIIIRKLIKSSKFQPFKQTDELSFGHIDCTAKNQVPYPNTVTRI